jgi:hypothetical protein
MQKPTYNINSQIPSTEPLLPEETSGPSKTVVPDSTPTPTIYTNPNSTGG